MRAQNEILLMADQPQIAPGADVPNHRPLNRRGGKHASHLQIVGADQAPVSDLLAQDIGDPLFRERRRSFLFFGYSRKSGVRNHDHRQFAPQG